MSFVWCSRLEKLWITDDFPEMWHNHEYISITRLELTEDPTIPNWLWSRHDANRNRWSVDAPMLVRCTADSRTCRRFTAPNFPRMGDSTGLYYILLIVPGLEWL